MLPDADVGDWLSWPADLLLNVGGWVASWFFDKDASSFIVEQMMFATLVLAAIMTLIVYWQTLFGYLRSRGKASAGSKHPLQGG